MDENRANPALGGAANTPPFDRPGAGRNPRETRTEHEIERTRDMVAQTAAPVLAEKTQEAIEETAHRLTEGPTGEQMREQVRRTASAARDDASDMVRQRAGAAFGQMEARANDFMDRAAEGMENAARRIDKMAERQAAASGLAHGAAGRMENVAGYLRNHDVQTLRRDLEGQVRERPLQTLLLGVAAGWVAGKILR